MPAPAAGSGEQPVDYESLAAFLRALGYPARLELLDALRFPKLVSEIKLVPTRTSEGENPDRPVARQTVQTHLDTLVDSGFVQSETVDKGGRQLRQYAVNPQRLYAVVEELRRLSTIYAGRGALGDATGTIAGAPPREQAPSGPRLVLVHGVYEGKPYLLDPSLASQGTWLIGRKRGLQVSLDYDPFVSGENSSIERREGVYLITDLPGSKNGTSVNWTTIPKGAPRALRSGDVIGVGRSLLLFLDN